MKRLLSAAWALARNDLLAYSRDRGALATGFLVPITLVTAFGWIMAYAFGGSSGMPKVKLWVADQDRTEQSQQLVERLRLSEMLAIEPRETAPPISAEQLRKKIATGDAHHGLVIPKGFTAESQSDPAINMQLIRDPGREMEDRIVRFGLMQSMMNQSNGSLWERSASRMFRNQGMSQTQLDSLEQSMKGMQETIQAFVNAQPAATPLPSNGTSTEASPETETEANTEVSAPDAMDFMTQIVPLDEENITPPSRPLMVTYQQAQSVSGTSVMMLMFGLAGAGMLLIAERDGGTLRRLFALPIPRESVLLGKFMFVSIIGLTQMVVLMVYSELVFRVGLFRDPLTLGVLVVSWVATAGSFGMLIATFSKSAKQGDGLATILILVSAALGGCWFPIQQMSNMPLVMELTCKSTMTYWAMNGFQGMLWSSLGCFDTKIMLSVAVLWTWTLGLTTASIYLFRRNYVAD